jgi:hypothetical protein
MFIPEALTFVATPGGPQQMQPQYGGPGAPVNVYGGQTGAPANMYGGQTGEPVNM